LYDVIIVGSGPSGVAASYQLQDKNILLLDVGNTPDKKISLDENYYDIKKKADLYFKYLIGDNFESLNNIDKDYLMPKIKSPLQRFVIADSDRFGKVESETFNGFISYAQGGLANAWGAQLYRFNDSDLKEFPISPSDLEPYYDKLTKLIGICGETDDLARFYGHAKDLLPSLQLNYLGKDLLKKYTKQKEYFNQKKIYIGRPRLGVLSTDFLNRKRCDYCNLEFFQPGLRYIYTPSITLDELIAKKQIDYRPRYIVLKYRQLNNKVLLDARNIDTNQSHTFEAGKVILAAGTLGTTKIILNSNGDFQTKLPIMENLLSYIPFINFFKIGSKQEKCSFYTQLNLCYTGDPCQDLIMGTFYSITGIFHSDVLFDIPLSVRSSIAVSKYVIPAMLVLHLWYPSKLQDSNYVYLNRSGNLHITYEGKLTGNVERYLIKSFQKIGYFSMPSLCKYPKPGNSFHYAGTVPMRQKPTKKYETDYYGRLHGTRNVYIADGSNFPSLPAKNLSFTIMANAMRIADHVKAELQKGL
jgi:hypothetical protein